MHTNLYHELNLRPETTATPLESGDLLHKIYEQYYLGVKEFGKELVYDTEKFKKHLDYCINFGSEYSINLDLTPEEVDEIIKHAIENLTFWRMDGIEVHEVEKAFLVPLWSDGDFKLFYSGKIDLIATFPDLGKVVIDHKSFRRSSSPDPLSNQFTGYSSVAGIKTVVINKVGFQKTLKPEQRFIRPVIYYTDDQLNRWIENVVWWARQYLTIKESGVWPENRTSCDKYNGCIFHRICNSGTDESREWIMQSAFKIGEPWDVTKGLGNQ